MTAPDAGVLWSAGYKRRPSRSAQVIVGEAASRETRRSQQPMSQSDQLHQRSDRPSQLDVAYEIGVSPKHLSFVETGRSRPGPELIDAIGIHLDIPLRERNTMLLSAGFAPDFQHTPLDDPVMGGVVASLQRLLDAQNPYPGLVLDGHWNVVLANTGAKALAAMLPDHLACPALNVSRASLHPDSVSGGRGWSLTQ